MFRNILLAGASVIALAGSAWAVTPVEEIKVDADLTAIKNPEAAKIFVNLPDDLTGAIASRLPPDSLVKDNGVKILVKVDTVELASTWANLADLSQSRLQGIVNVTEERNTGKSDHYDLSVSYPNATAFVPQGADVSVLTKDAGVYYTALISAFADHVVSNLK
ncbi:MAG TPA: hypothetical protein VGC40_01975 [Paenirhodobacter sp.]